MYKINKFAEIFNISSKTLRFYDKMNIINPEIINKGTGYRYYTNNQIGDMSAILQLKELGFSLSEIQAFMNNEISLNEKIKKIRNLQKISQNYLNNLTLFANVDNQAYQFKMETVPAKTVCFVDRVLRKKSMLIDVYPELYELTSKNHLHIVQPMDIYVEYERNDLIMNDILFTLHVEISTDENSIIDSSCVKTIKEAKKISTVHYGDYSTINDAYEFLINEANTRNLTIVGKPQEHFIRSYARGQSPLEYLIIVSFEVE